MSMSPSTLSALFPLSDITTKIGYDKFVSKLRLLEMERAGAELRAAVGVPDLGILKYEPNATASVAVAPHKTAKAAYKHLNPCDAAPVKHLLSILKNGAPPAQALALSRGSSQSSATKKLTVHDIAEAAYKRNSRNTENVQFLLHILNHGVPPSLSRTWSNSSTSSLTGSIGGTSPSASSVCLTECEDTEECDILKEEWECAEKWVDELVNDD